MATVADLEIKVTSDTADAEAGLGNVSRRLGDLPVDVVAATAAFDQLKSTGIDLFTGAINSAMDFEAAVIDAQIATNMSTDEIESMVYRLAEAYPVATIEVTNLIEELGKLGYAGEGLEALTETTIQLSSALGTDLIPTGELLDTLLVTVGGSADELSDKLFRLLSAGRLDAQSFADAWKYVGSVFKGSGLALEEMTGLIDLLVQSGLKAETAGRLLQNLFNSLMNPSEELMSLLSELGVTFTDLEGNMLSAGDILKNIFNEWENIVAQGRGFELAKMLVGEDFAASLMALFDRGWGAVENFIDKFESAMNLQDAMAAKMSSAKAMWDTFMEAVDNVSIVIGQQLIPAFKVILDFVTPLVSGFKELDSSVLQAVTIIGLLVTALAGVAATVGAASALGIITGALSIMASPIFIVVAALAALAGAAVWAYSNMEGFRAVVDRLIDAFVMVKGTGVDPVTAALRALGIVFPNLYGHVQTAISVWNVLKSAFSATIGVITSVASAIGSFVASLLSIGAVRDVLMGVVAAIAAFVAINKAIALFNTLRTAIVGFRAVLIGARVAMIAFNAAMLSNPFVLIAAAIIGLGVAVYLLYQRFEAVRNVVDPILDLFKDLAKLAGKGIAKAFDKFTDAVEPIVDAFKDVTKITDKVEDAFDALGDKVNEVRAFFALFRVLGANPLEAALGTLSVYFPRLGNAISSVIGFFQNLTSIVSGAVMSAFNAATGAVSQLIGWFVNLATESGLVSAAFEFVGTAIEALVEFFDTASDAVSQVVDAFGDGGLMGALQALPEALSTVGEGFVELGSSILDGLISAVQSIDWGMIGSAILEGIQNMIAGLVGLASSLASWFTEQVGSVNWSDLFQAAIDILTNVGQWILDKIGQGIALGAEIFAWLWNIISSIAWADIFTAALEVLKNVAQWILDKIKSGIAIGGEIFAWLWDQISAIDWMSLFEAGMDILSTVGQWILDKIKSGVALGGEIFAWLWDQISGVDWLSVFEAAMDVLSTVGEWIVNKIKSGAQVAGQVFAWLWDQVSAVHWMDIFKAALDVLKGVGKFIVDLVRGGVNVGGEVFAWLWEKVSSIDWLSVFKSAMQPLKDVGQTIIDLIKGGWDEFTTWLDEKINAIIDRLNGFIEQANEVPGFDIPLFSRIGDDADDATAAMERLGQEMDLLARKALNPMGSKVGQVLGQRNVGLTEQDMQINEDIYGDPFGGGGGGGSGSYMKHFMQPIQDEVKKTTRIIDTESSRWPVLAQTNARSIPTLSRPQFAQTRSAAQTELSSVPSIIGTTLGSAANIAATALSSFGIGASQNFGRVPTSATTALSPLGAMVGGFMSSAKSEADTNLTGMGSGADAAFAGIPMAATMQLGQLAGIVSLQIQNANQAARDSFVTFVADTIGVLGGWIGGVTNMMSTFSTSFHPPISMGTSQGKQSFITFVADTIAVMGGWIGGLTTIATTAMSTFRSQMSQGTSAGKQSVVTFVADTIGVMGGWSSGIKTNVTSTMSTFKSQMSSGTSAAKTSVTSFVSQTIAVMGGWANGMRTNVTNTMNSVRSAINSGMQNATTSITTHSSAWVSIISSRAGAMRSAGLSVGQAAGAGVAQGMLNSLGAVTAAANAIISQVDRAMRAKARISSPSKMTEYLGRMIGEGLVEGMDRMIRPLTNKADQTAMAIVRQLNGVLSSQNRRDLAGTIVSGVTDAAVGNLVKVLEDVLSTSVKSLMHEGQRLFGVYDDAAKSFGREMGKFGGAILNGWEKLTEGFWRDVQSGIVVKGILAEDGSYVNPGFHSRSMPMQSSSNTTIYQTNHYTIDVKDMQELNEAVEFVSDLDRQRQLVMSS